MFCDVAGDQGGLGGVATGARLSGIERRRVRLVAIGAILAALVRGVLRCPLVVAGRAFPLRSRRRTVRAMAIGAGRRSVFLNLGACPLGLRVATHAGGRLLARREGVACDAIGLAAAARRVGMRGLVAVTARTRRRAGILESRTFDVVAIAARDHARVCLLSDMRAVSFTCARLLP